MMYLHNMMLMIMHWLSFLLEVHKYTILLYNNILILYF